MNEQQHDEVRSLLGAYVLDAVDPLEHKRVERHISNCAECAREVSLLGAAAAELALLTPVEGLDDELVERISSALPRRARRLVTRGVTAVAAVAIAAAGFLGLSLVRAQDHSERLASIVAAADRAVALHGQAGFEGRGHLYIRGDEAALVLKGLPDAGKDRVYQLWAIRGTQPKSMAVVAGTDQIVQLFEWSGSADTFAVTIEPTGGSPVPTSDPVLVSA